MFKLYLLYTKDATALHSLKTEFNQICCYDSNHFGLTFLGLWTASVIKLPQISLKRKFRESYLGAHVANHLYLVTKCMVHTKT